MEWNEADVCCVSTAIKCLFLFSFCETICVIDRRRVHSHRRIDLTARLDRAHRQSIYNSKKLYEKKK